MAEYISKQDVIDYLNGYLHSLGEDADTLFNRGQRRALINSIQDILAVKAAEVQPVKYGYWTDLNNDAIFHYECSCCKGHTDWHENFCPNCGARMDGEQNENN